jgi:hypothetical protein
MKKPLFVAAMVFGVMALAGARAASAQEIVRVHVPFPFLVDGHQLPAGDYRVDVEPTPERVLAVVGNDGRSCAFSIYEGTGLDASWTSPNFQFKKVGGTYILWRVSAPGLDVVELPLSTGAAAAPKLAKSGNEKGHKGND